MKIITSPVSSSKELFIILHVYGSFPLIKRAETMQTKHQDKGLHPAVGDPKPFKGSGKDIGLVDPPIVSVNPVSEDSKQGIQGDKPRKEEIKVIDVSNDFFFTKTEKADEGMYPFATLKFGQGFFVPVKEGQTTDRLMENMYATIAHVRDDFSEQMRNKNGDTILDDVTIETRKKNDDGTLQLDSFNKPIVGANATHIPRMIYTRNFIAKAVVKDDQLSDGFKSPGDGVLVIRVV